MQRFLIIFIFLFLAKHSFAQDTIVIDKSAQAATNGKESYFFTEKDSGLEDVIHQQFKPKKDVNLYFITGVFWIKFVIHNTSSINNFVIRTSDGHVSGLYLYKPTSNGYVMTPP